MTRKSLVWIIASLYIAQGLWVLGSSFFPILTSPKPFTIDLFPILAGALGLWAGIYLFKLDEFGRKFVIVFLFCRIAYNLFFVVWAPSQEDLRLALTLFDRSLFASTSNSIFVFTLLVWILFAICAIVFLTQEKTKALFVSAAVGGENSPSLYESV